MLQVRLCLISITMPASPSRCGLQGAKKFAVILAFDVPVNREAQQLAESMGVRIFTADIIYHLFDQFTAYLKQVC